jgi:glutathione synthase/RimK-type ligase-like ATP-grasp enzyme
MTRHRVALITSTEAWQIDEDAPLLVHALAEQGIDAEPVIWDTSKVDWARYRAVILRSPWDYTERPEEFLDVMQQIQLHSPVLNPLEVLRWNIDKHYLADLAQAGLAVVPTTFIDDLDSLKEDSFPAEGGFVVKPTISSGSRNSAHYSQTQRSEAAAHATRLLHSQQQVMVQPYLGSVDHVGETGMVFFLGEFSHGFRKAALLGQGSAAIEGLYAPEEIETREPSAAELELARRALEITSEQCGTGPLLYARVDVLQGDDGEPQLLELELTEPSYFLRTDPSSAQRAAAAYARALS